MTSTYLKIIGRITEEKTLKISHSYLVEMSDVKKQTIKSPLRADCLDKAGKVLISTPLPARPYNLPREIPNLLAVRALIPVPSRAKNVRFFLDGKPVLDLPIRDTSPEIHVDWVKSLAGVKAQGKRQIHWKPAVDKHAAYRAYYEYSIDDGKTWRRLQLAAEGKTYAVDLDRLPGGKKCRLALVVTDGVRVTRSESPAFSNAVKPCVPMLFRPADGATFAAGAPVELVGQGFYLEEQKPEVEELRWESSKEGLLGSGRTLEATNLRKGKHTITLTAGKGRRAGSKSVEITIK